MHIAVRDESAARVEIESRLIERGLVLRQLEVIAPSLEDAFVAEVRAAGGAPVD
mgnify:FL=1